MTNGPFRQYSSYVALLGLVALVLVWALPLNASAHLGALVGVGMALLSGLVGLWMKRKVREAGIEVALRAVGVVFALRLLLMGGGLAWVMKRKAGQVEFVVAFFAVYFVLQWLEIGYVLSENKRRGQKQ